MPNILKSLLKSTIPSRSSRSHHPQPLSPGALSQDDHRNSSYSTEDLTQLTADLARRLTSHNEGDDGHAQAKSKSKSRSSAKLKSRKSRGTFQDKLHTAVQAIQSTGQPNRIDPYLTSHSGSPATSSPSIHRPQAISTTSYIPPTYTTTQASSGDEWRLAFQSCSAALTEHLTGAKRLPSDSQPMAERCVKLLDAQRDELFVMRPWAEDKPLPMFRTLTQVYTEMIHAFEQVSADPKTGSRRLLTVVQVLQEGPDYLIDIGLIECVVWQAEVIDPAYGADIRNLLDEAVKAQVDLQAFRKRLETMIDVALHPPHASLDDDLGQDAFDAIQKLVKQLKSRLRSSVPNSVAVAPSSGPGTPTTAPSTSSSTSSFPIANASAYTPHNAQTLQEAYGTGPVPSHLPSPYPSRAPSPPTSPTSTSSSQKSIFEYRGHRLTRSALELVQTQERLAMADSSGQYAGEVDWDELRNCWIPVWAEKLRPGDLVDGEVGDTNPANFKERKRDAWGNKIGWYEGRMYYEEEPSFELRS